MSLFPHMPDMDAIQADFDAVRDDIAGIRKLLLRLVELEEAKK